MTIPPEAAFAPCPTCGQYSHSLGEDRVADAYNLFHAMTSMGHKAYPTHHLFDEKMRDAAEVLLAEIERLRAIVPNQQTLNYRVGDQVEKPRGYPFPGTVVAEFMVEGGQRFVVESETAPGMLHIFSARQLRHRSVCP